VGTKAQTCRSVSSQRRHISTIRKKLLNTWWQRVLASGHIGATSRIRLNLCFLRATQLQSTKGKSDRFSHCCTGHGRVSSDKLSPRLNTIELVHPSAARVHNANLKSIDRFSRFWATVCMLSDRCLSCPVLSVCLSVCCDVGVLWPSSWMDPDETWHAGRPRPWTHCVR